MVQSQLGHASYKTTQRYAHIAPQRIKAATENVAKEIELAITDGDIGILYEKENKKCEF